MVAKMLIKQTKISKEKSERSAFTQCIRKSVTKSTRFLPSFLSAIIFHLTPFTITIFSSFDGRINWRSPLVLIFQIFSDVACHRKILDAQVKCPNNACSWAGELRDVKVTTRGRGEGLFVAYCPRIFFSCYSSFNSVNGNYWPDNK